VADGGWTEAANVLGIPINDGLLNGFRNEDGTITAMAGYDFDSSENNGVTINSDGDYINYVLSDNHLIKRLNVLPNIIFLDRVNYRSARVIVENPDIRELDEVNEIFKGWRELLLANSGALVAQA